MQSQIGEQRKFLLSKIVKINVKNKSDKLEQKEEQTRYEIQDILENPGVSMLWSWQTGVCPYCKMKIERSMTHQFYRIEILVECYWNETEQKWAAINNPIIDNLYILGDSLDNKKMMIIKDKYNEVLAKSEKFKYLIGGI